VFVTAALADLHKELEPHYSDIGRPSVDPELMIRMLIVGYCYGIRSERRLTEEVELHLAYRWFCKLDLEDEIPHHSIFSLNRLGRFRESDVLRHVFERLSRLRLRGLSGARDEFHLAAIIQNLKTLALRGLAAARPRNRVSCVRIVPAASRSVKVQPAAPAGCG
jgi:Transposase domain (DUF772)